FPSPWAQAVRAHRRAAARPRQALPTKRRRGIACGAWVCRFPRWRAWGALTRTYGARLRPQPVETGNTGTLGDQPCHGQAPGDLFKLVGASSSMESELGFLRVGRPSFRPFAEHFHTSPGVLDAGKGPSTFWGRLEILNVGSISSVRAASLCCCRSRSAKLLFSSTGLELTMPQSILLRADEVLE